MSNINRRLRFIQWNRCFNGGLLNLLHFVIVFIVSTQVSTDADWKKSHSDICIALLQKSLVPHRSSVSPSALGSSASTVPSVRPSLPSPPHSRSFLTNRQTSVPLHPSFHFPSALCLSTHCSGLMELKEVLQVLEQLAPLSLAESWDNVGLLVEPSKPRPVKTVLLTNDLTDAVMEEAEAMSCDLIISYHPPLFQSIKRLVQKNWKQRLAVRAVEAGMAIFSPHTSWDSVKGGVNDWLVGGLGETPLCHMHFAYATCIFNEGSG